jgi:hypothetical protein
MISSTALGNFPAFRATNLGYASRNNIPRLAQTFALRPDLGRTIGPVGKRAAQRKASRKPSRKCA